MVTKEQIVTQAYKLIDAGEINSFDDGTKEANYAKSRYAQTRDSLISSYAWNFALNTTELARDVDAPEDQNWQFQYELPSDFLTLRKAITISGGNTAAVIRGNKILANDDRIKILYMRSAPETEFPPYFIEALVHLIAANSAEMLIGEPQVTLDISTKAERAIKEAKRIDAQENPLPNLMRATSSSWVRASRGGGSRGYY